MLWVLEIGVTHWMRFDQLSLEDMNLNLLAPFALEEVKAATFQMGALKSPGLDGFSGLFYHKYWEIVRNLVHETSKDFRNGSVSLQALNQTHIVLIPKVHNPEFKSSLLSTV